MTAVAALHSGQANTAISVARKNAPGSRQQIVTTSCRSKRHARRSNPARHAGKVSIHTVVCAGARLFTALTCCYVGRRLCGVRQSRTNSPVIHNRTWRNFPLSPRHAQVYAQLRLAVAVTVYCPKRPSLPGSNRRNANRCVNRAGFAAASKALSPRGWLLFGKRRLPGLLTARRGPKRAGNLDRYVPPGRSAESTRPNFDARQQHLRLVPPQ
jgi:hypothetical protein